MGYKLLVIGCKFIIIFIFYIFLTTYNLQLTTIHAQEMDSQNFKISGGNFNMTSGNKSSTSFKLSDVVGQTASGMFVSKGYILNAGFLNSAAGEVFSFSVTPSEIDFGELSPDTPVEKTLRITISNGNVPGYSVKASENQPLSTSVGATILDTVCGQNAPCSITTANKWSDDKIYGMGYKMSGKTVPKDFNNSDFYRPFAATVRNDPPTTVMETRARKVVDQATMTIKVNTNKSQPVGQYRNVISFIAMAGI